MVVKARAVEQVANGGLADPRLIGLDTSGDAELFGVNGAVRRRAKLHNAKSVDLATTRERAIVVVRNHTLHRVGLDACTRAIAAERLRARAVGVDEVWVILVGR